MSSDAPKVLKKKKKHRRSDSSDTSQPMHELSSDGHAKSPGENLPDEVPDDLPKKPKKISKVLVEDLERTIEDLKRELHHHTSVDFDSMKKDVQERIKSMERIIEGKLAEIRIEREKFAMEKSTEKTLQNFSSEEYATSLITLTKYPDSMLGAMFSGKYKIATDWQGRHFIDRDGALFKHILNYLRTDTLSFDITNELLARDVLREAEFFQLETLAEVIRPHDLSSINSVSHQLPPTAVRRLSGKKKKHTESCLYSRKEIHQMKVKQKKGKVLNMAGLDLVDIDLSRLDLSFIDFSRCTLKGANFENAVLIGCKFSQCNLQNASFQQAVFGSAEKESADFTDADLRGTTFSRYLGALYANRFEGANLDGSIGLDPAWLR